MAASSSWCRRGGVIVLVTSLILLLSYLALQRYQQYREAARPDRLECLNLILQAKRTVAPLEHGHISMS